jgi:hypothetical protein
MTKIGLTFALCNQINKIKDPNKQMPKTLLCQSNRFLKLDWTRKHIIIEFQDYKNKLFPHLSLLLSSSQLSNQTNSERGESYCIFTNMLGKEKKGSYHQSFLLQWWRRDNWTESEANTEEVKGTQNQDSRTKTFNKTAKNLWQKREGIIVYSVYFFYFFILIY